MIFFQFVYVARNPKDMVLSVADFLCAQRDVPNDAVGDKLASLTFSGLIEGQVNEVTSEQNCYGPLRQHVMAAWRRRNDPNMLFTTYEEMKRDLPGVVRKLAVYLNVELSDEAVRIIAERNTIETLRKAASNNRAGGTLLGPTCKAVDVKFFNKGQVGRWKQYLTVEQSEKIDKYCEEGFEGFEFEFE